MQSISQERIKECLILVVDDLEVNRELVLAILKSAGYTNVMTAEHGLQALQITEKSPPDLVILDLMMPYMDGLEYCRRVRQNPAFNNMPILIQTVLDDKERKLDAFRAGASDYLCKPVTPEELVARTQVHLAQKLLMHDLQQYQMRTSMELEAARTMQDRLMPSAHHIAMHELVFDMKIDAICETSSQLGGDCWGMRAISNTKLAIWLYDFSGHGVSAAMNVFRTNTILQECLFSHAEPGSLLTAVSKRMHAILQRDEFATMFYGIIDTEANCLLYSSAASPSALVFSQADQAILTLDGRGMPLGVQPDTVYETRYFPFSPEDMLVVYSDCLIEAQDAEGQYISEEQIRDATSKAIHAESDNPANHVVRRLYSLLMSHNQGLLADDLTIMAYSRNKVAQAAAIQPPPSMRSSI